MIPLLKGLLCGAIIILFLLPSPYATAAGCATFYIIWSLQEIVEAVKANGGGK